MADKNQRASNNSYGDVDRNAGGNLESEPTSLFSMANLKVAQVNIVAGTLNGYSIGFVGVYSNLYGLSTNCKSYRQPKACTTLSNSKCSWNSAIPQCVWVGKPICSQYATPSTCDAVKDCRWSYGDDACANPSGYTASENGIFAGSMIVGCLIGSFFAGPIAKRLGPSISFLVVGIVSVICSVMYHVAAGVDQFWVLCVGRLLIGMVLGLVCVAAPMYVSENAYPKYSKMIGVMFQIFTTFGIFLAATIGLAVGQSVQFNNNSDQHLMARMQALCVFSTVLSVIMILLGIFLRSKKGDGSAEEQAEQQQAEANLKQYSFLQMTGPLLVGIIVAGTLQLTGINAVMNYAPTIMGSLGLDPLVGNFIVMLWNFVTTIVSVPLASVFSMRTMFLGGSIVTSVCCLFLCGIPVYPGVTPTKAAKNGVAITGILIFIAAFEMGVGPCFYVLAQDLFPQSFRPKGASVTMVAQFVFNVIINVCYPIATEKMSGGPSGNQDKGQAIAFIFFGSIGIVCFVVQIFFLFPWDDSMDSDLEHKAAAVPHADIAPIKDNEGIARVQDIDVAIDTPSSGGRAAAVEPIEARQK